MTTTDTQPIGRDAYRVFAPSELGRNNNPPPYRYQRRIDYLGPAPKRSPQFRSDWLEGIRAAHSDGKLPVRAVMVAGVVADASNANGKDICFTETWFARRLHKLDGKTYSARYASDGLDDLRKAGWIDWEHGQEHQRFDDARRQLLGGRWQGAATYRMFIPVSHQRLLDERRAAARNRRNGPGRTSTTPGHRPVQRHSRIDNKRRSAIIDDAHRVAEHASSFDTGTNQLAKNYRADEYELAYDEFVRAWQNRTRGST